MRHDPEGFPSPETVSEILRDLPARVPPHWLTTSLRVIASRERQRKLERRSLAAMIAGWRDRFDLFAAHLLRPLALPCAGGLFCTVILFSMCVVPTFPVRANSTADVPTMLTTEATLKGTSPFAVSGDEIVVDITIDDQGRMIDYRVVGGCKVLDNQALRRRLENMLLFTEFTPATTFGQPVAGRIRVSLRSSQIDVKG